MNKSKDDYSSERMSQIFQFDIASVCHTLQSLEAKLTEHNKQDKLPPWAQSLIQRIELLEGNSSSIKDIIDDSESNLSSIIENDKLRDQIRHEIDMKNAGIKLSLESKISSMSLEMDRLYKLLQIRPTTSELQSVVVSVEDIGKKSQNAIGNLSHMIRGTVQEIVTDEMDSITKRILLTEENANKSVSILSEKIDECASGVLKFKETMSELMTTTKLDVELLKEEAADFKHVLDSVKSNFESFENVAKTGIENLEDNLLNLNSTFNEHEATMGDRLDSLDSTIQSIEDLVREESIQTENKHMEIVEAIESTKKILETVNMQLQSDMAAIKEEQMVLRERMNKTDLNVKILTEYIESLQSFDVMTKLTRFGETLDQLTNDTQTNESDINNSRIQLQNLRNEQAETAGELATYPDKLVAIYNDIEIAKKDSKANAETLKVLKGIVQDNTHQIADLSLLKEDTIIIKEVCSSQDEKVKKVIKKVTEVTTVLESVDTRIERNYAAITSTDLKMKHESSDIKAELQEVIATEVTALQGNFDALKEMIVNFTTSSSSHGKNKLSKQSSKVGSPGGFVGDSISATGEMNPPSSSINGSKFDDDYDDDNSFRRLVEICTNFEEVAVFRCAAPKDLSKQLCKEIASISSRVAPKLSQSVDVDAIMHLLHNNPENIIYEDNQQDQRMEKIRQFILKIQSLLQSAVPGAGAVRMEARDIFLSKLNHALQLAMTKCDQVILTGQSRVGRIKVPSCIACDRPLLSRVIIEMYLYVYHITCALYALKCILHLISYRAEKTLYQIIP